MKHHIQHNECKRPSDDQLDTLSRYLGENSSDNLSAVNQLAGSVGSIKTHLVHNGIGNMLI